MKSLRKIQLDNHIFLWKRKHFHESGSLGMRCVEAVTIFKEGHKQSPLRILFRSDEIWQCGYPKQGVVWRTTPSKELVNLSRPKSIARLIDLFYTVIWKPESSTRPTTIQDGVHYLDGMIEKFTC